MSTKRKIYGLQEQERLDETPEEVIARVYNNMKEGEISFPIRVYAFTPQDTKTNGKDLIDRILEDLDQDYGDPDGDYTTPSENMLKAANALAKVIREDYRVFACDNTGEFKEYSHKEVIAIGSTFEEISNN